MRIYLAYITIILLLFPAFSYAQINIDCEDWELESGTYSSVAPLPSTKTSIDSVLMKDARIVFCPAGIERYSSNDVKKRYPFEWKVKYNNFYLRTSGGIVFEGMNEHGFSASLMFLKNSRLPDKEKELIPIAASLTINFFIDHFKCIDTALLAIWDIRIFDDIGLECGWPFRIVLHDSTGSTAIVEYVRGTRQVYTPDPPALIVGGPDYARLITISHLPDSIPGNEAEIRYKNILETNIIANEETYQIWRSNGIPEVLIFNPNGEDRYFSFKEIEFIPGEEVSIKLF